MGGSVWRTIAHLLLLEESAAATVEQRNRVTFASYCGYTCRMWYKRIKSIAKETKMFRASIFVQNKRHTERRQSGVRKAKKRKKSKRGKKKTSCI